MEKQGQVRLVEAISERQVEALPVSGSVRGFFAVGHFAVGQFAVRKNVGFG